MTATIAGKSGLPLGGLKVLELGHIVSGPTAGQILADLGAEVTKIEPVTGGDQTRAMPGPQAAMFGFLNRNKGSIALDLKGEGRAVFLRMAATADIIIDNFSYRAVERLGIGYDTVSADNPGVIWLSIKGFLPGPLEELPMLDELAQMMGGLAFMTGPEGQPLRAGCSVIDIGAATYGVIAVLAALRTREQGGGRGQYITAGLFETSAYLVGQWVAVGQCSGNPSIPIPKMRQGTRMGWGIYRLFETLDHEQVFIGITSNTHWRRFCEEFDQADLFANPNYANNIDRARHRPELNARFSEIIGSITLAEALQRLHAAKVPYAPLRRPDQLPYETQLIEGNQLVRASFPDGSTGLVPKLPFRASGFEMDAWSDAPALGADTRRILTELGYTAEEIAGLIERRAVASAEPAEAGDAQGAVS
jgi:crotonobetainyl-CoA:carnitine CoA-transferase CaiB-like acyl-CoA transferase